MAHQRQDTFVSMRMPHELYKWLKEKADKAHRSVSWVVRKYLAEYKEIEDDILN